MVNMIAADALVTRITRALTVMNVDSHFLLAIFSYVFFHGLCRVGDSDD